MPTRLFVYLTNKSKRMKVIKRLKFFSIFVGIILAGKISAQCTASFIYSTSGGGVYSFTSTSVGTSSVSTTYTWSFGNSSYSVGLGMITASTTYTANGSYTVSLNFSTPCSSFTSAIITVTNVAGCSLLPGVTYNQGSNGTVNFTNTSTGTVSGTTYTLDYGDGASGNSFASHTYSANGTYIATLTANNNTSVSCTGSQTLAINVTSYCTIVPGFTISQLGNGYVDFTSTSTGTIASSTYSWNFGDGSPIYGGVGSSYTNTTHYYANGTYTAILSIVNSTAPLCSNASSLLVSVTSNTCNTNASFSHTVMASGMVGFNSTTTGTVGTSVYSWNFGDGFTGSGASVNHTYASAGNYPVSLTVQSTTACIQTATMVVNVTTSSCVANAMFSVTPTATPQVWNVTPSFPWNISSAVWSWGDGSTSNNLYSSHTYSAAGTYSLCLTVTVACGATDSWCGSYFINKSAEPLAPIQINVIQPSSVPQSIKILNISESKFSVYPNPATDEFYIKLEKEIEEGSLSIYNLNGEMIYSKSVNIIEEIKLDAKDISSGVYIIRIISETWQGVNKIIVTH